MKSWPVSKSVVLRTKPNHTFVTWPKLTSRRATTTSFGCANGHSRSSSWVTRTMRVWRSTRSSVRRRAWYRIRQDADQRARDLDTDRPDDDALDPLLGGQGGLRFDRSNFPDERKNKSQRANGTNERLADMDPGGYQVRNRRDV